MDKNLEFASVEAHLLQGKHNYLEWRRYFDRAAKSLDVWDHLQGIGVVENEPTEEDNIVYTTITTTTTAATSPDPTPSTPATAKKKVTRSTSVAASTSEPQADEKAEQVADPARSLLRWQAAYKRWETSKAKARLAIRLILKSVSEPIAIELEDMTNPTEMFTHARETYGLTDEGARAQTLEKIAKLKLSDCSSVTEYFNKHRELKYDLIRAKFTSYDDSQMITNVLKGLPRTYNNFQKMWEWKRAEDPHSDPNITFFAERLLMEEENIKQNRRNQNGPQANQSSTPKADKPTCTTCGKPNHTEEKCWFAHPELRPTNTANKKKPENESAAKNHDNGGKRNMKIVALAMAGPQVKQALAMLTEPLEDAEGPSTLTPTPQDLSNNSSQSLLSNESTEETGMEPWNERILKDEGERHVKTFVSRKCLALAQEHCKRSGDAIILDSGADVCVFNNKKWFADMRPTSFTISAVDDESTVQIQGGGNVILTLEGPTGDETEITLTGAAYAPNARYNIISLSQLAVKAKLHGRWDDRGITIEQDSYLLAVAEAAEGLYFVRTSCEPGFKTGRNVMALIKYDSPVWEWHRRLGHLSFQNMINLLDISEGIPLTKEMIRAHIHEICPVCGVTRALVHIPRDPAKRRQTEIGQLIHVDTWGPYPIEGYDGTRLFLFFTDDATRFTWADAMARKKDLFKSFRKLHRKIEKEFNVEVRAYRFDGEFAHGAVGKYVTKKGVRVELTVPYAHYMGGAHERVNRIIREKAAPIIQEHTIAGQLTKIISEKAVETIRESSLPENLWPEAMKLAVWLKNRSPTRALKKTTPWQAVYGQPPTFGRESIWGSRMYVTFPPETHRMGKPKLHAPRGWLGYFVGCDAESIYRIYNPDHHRVFRIGMARIQQGVGTDDPHDSDKRASESEQAQSLPCSPDEELHSSDVRVNEAMDNQIPYDDNFWIESEDDQEPNPTKDETLLEENQSQHETSDDENGNSVKNQTLSSQRMMEPEDEPGTRKVSPDSTPKQTQRREISPSRLQLGDSSDSEDEEQPVKSHFFGKQVEKKTPSETLAEKSRFFAAMLTVLEQNFHDNGNSDDESDWVTVHDDDSDSESAQCYFRINLAEKLAKSSSGSETDSTFSYDSDGDIKNKKSKRIRYNARPDKVCFKCLSQGYTCWWDNYDDAACRRCAQFTKFTRCRLVKPEFLEEVAKTGREYQKRMIAQANENREIRRQKRGLPVGVPVSEKCVRCLKKGSQCDGRQPCNACGTRYPCIKQGREKDPKCVPCKSGTRACNREQPCGTCKKKGIDCSYYAQDGLVKRIWPVTEKCKKKFEKMQSDKCVSCTSTKMRCDGEQPCGHCLKRLLKDLAKTGKMYSSCSFKNEEKGCIEMYYTSPYEIGEDGTWRLKDDWETQTPITLNVKSRRGKRGKPRRHIEGMSFTTIRTPGQDLECGLHALALSIEAQQPEVRAPTVAELREIRASEEFVQANEAVDRDNENNLFVDQIALILRLWGDTIGVSFQLGVALENAEPMVIFGEEGRTTVWIHNDNASRQEGVEYNHFSGVRMMEAETMETQNPPTTQQESSEEDKEDAVDDDVSLYFPKKRRVMMATAIQTDKPMSLPCSECDPDDDAYDSDQIEFEENDENEVDADIKFFRQQQQRNAMTAKKNVGELPDPQTYAEAMRCSDAEEWTEAMLVERQSLEKTGTFKLVHTSEIPEGLIPLKSKWVYKRKLDQNNEVKRYKARLVAKGYLQREGFDFNEKYSAVIKSTSYRILIALAAILGWPVHLMDVVTAFLNGELKEEVYLKPPPGWKLPKDTVWRLQKALYGLKQAPRVWYEKLRARLLEWDFRISPFDPCVFIHDKREIILGIWVDDMLIIAKNQEALNYIKTKMVETFEMKDEGLCTQYLGIQIHQMENGILLEQRNYVQQILSKFNLTNMAGSNVPMNAGAIKTTSTQEKVDEDFRLEYQRRTGTLNYLTGATRFDASLATNVTSRDNANPSEESMDRVKRIFAYLKRHAGKGYLYQKGNTELVGYSDADHAGCPDTRRSTTGYVFMLGGAPICWKSQRQKTVALSTTHAEYVAVAEAAKEGVWIRNFINDLNIEKCKYEKVTIYMDNDSARKLTRNPEFHDRTKYVDTRYHFVRERVMEVGDIETERVGTKDNLADVLTKPLPRQAFEEAIRRMGMVDTGEYLNSASTPPSDSMDP